VRNHSINDFLGRIYSIDKVHLNGVLTLKKCCLLLLLVLFSFNIYSAHTYTLPKVLFLTTGDGEGNGTVSDGVVMALQSFNKLGVQTRLENREILLKPEELSAFSILIVPTRIGYHDQPHPISLTFMSEGEMKNISDWVRNGGTLIAGNNLGRNSLNLVDRLSISESLNPTNWALSECLGFELKEMDVSTFHLNDISLGQWDEKIRRTSLPRWFLAPFNMNQSLTTYSWWHNGSDSIPGITNNKFGKGNALFLPTFDLLHPKDDGGLSSQKELDLFYEFVYDLSIGERTNQIHLHPWKSGSTSAFCWTFDDGGTYSEYQRVVNFIRKNQSETVFFVTPEVDSTVIPLLINQPEISLEGHSFSHPDFRDLSYFETKNEFLRNKQFWNASFKGFRFPYVSNSFWGMYELGELDFSFETSIAANHVEYIRGSVVPYNIPIYNDDFYRTLDVLEISQIYRSDWYFYQEALNEDEYSIENQE
jgi:Polysaccharide deacetylase